jgi:hypothetical protein
MVRKALSNMSRFGVHTPLVSNKLNTFSKDPNSNYVFEVGVSATVSAKQSSAEDVFWLLVCWMLAQ